MPRRVNCRKVCRRCGCRSASQCISNTCSFQPLMKMRIRVFLSCATILAGDVSVILILIDLLSRPSVPGLPYTLHTWALLALGAGHLLSMISMSQTERHSLKFARTKIQTQLGTRTLAEFFLLRPFLFLIDAFLLEEAPLERFERVVHNQHVYNFERLMFFFYIPLIFAFFDTFSGNFRSAFQVFVFILRIAVASGVAATTTYWEDLDVFSEIPDTNGYIFRLCVFIFFESIAKSYLPLIAFTIGVPFLIGYLVAMWAVDVAFYYIIRGGLLGGCNPETLDYLQFSSHLFFDVLYPLGTSRSVFDFCARLQQKHRVRITACDYSEEGVWSFDRREMRWVVGYVIRCLIGIAFVVLAELRLLRSGSGSVPIASHVVIFLPALSIVINLAILRVQYKSYHNYYEMIATTGTRQSSVVQLQIPADLRVVDD